MNQEEMWREAIQHIIQAYLTDKGKEKVQYEKKIFGDVFGFYHDN